MGCPKLAAPRRLVIHTELRVLVIDDDPAFRAVVSRLLDQEHTPVAVGAGDEALLRLAVGAPYDVVLLDLNMPHPDGIEIYDTLARTCPWLLDRVVIVTGGARSDRERAFLESIPNETLTKP